MVKREQRWLITGKLKFVISMRKIRACNECNEERRHNDHPIREVDDTEDSHVEEENLGR